MKLLRNFKVFFSLNPKMMLLVLEAFVYLGWARILLYLPFTRISSLLGAQMQETPETLRKTDKVLLKQISSAIGIMSNHTIWESKCLVKAIAGMKMLQRRRIESTLYLGTAKDERGELIAHAWLRSGPYYLTGAEVKNRFTVVGKFAKRINNI